MLFCSFVGHFLGRLFGAGHVRRAGIQNLAAARGAASSGRTREAKQGIRDKRMADASQCAHVHDGSTGCTGCLTARNW